MPQKKATQVQLKQRATKAKKEKVAWTKESALDFIKKNNTKGLRFWSAADYLKKVHGIETKS
jgi:hypothetical protein